MNCTSCNAQLAPGSTSCFFCGARLARAGRAPASGGSARRGPASRNGVPLGWRTWVSFFLGGLYGPVSAKYLVVREEHLAGLRSGQLPPTPPSQLGRVVLSLFLGVPILFVAVLALPATASRVHRSHLFQQTGETVWVGVQATYELLFVNLAIAGFYAFSVVVARWSERRFELLVENLTDSDPHYVRLFRQGSAGRSLATAVALLPLVLIAIAILVVATRGWAQPMSTWASLWVPAVMAASWSSSWLGVQSATRYHAVASMVP